MAEHTPGPWEAYFVHGISADAYRIRSKTNAEWSVCFGPNWFAEHSQENMANAHLIAAAPDLLEALRRIHLLCAPNPERTFDELIRDTGLADDIARAAIAEAEGREDG